MNDNSMAAFRCWSAGQIAQTVFSDIGALAGDADSIFLAAHTPMDLEHLKGAELDLGSSGETRVLDALTSRIGDLERNTLVAVTGSSGSGKSHVVRWVRAHLPSDDPRYQVLYVPRAVQTLRELLRKVIEGLPGVAGADLMNRVDSAFAGVKPGELQERLVSEMKIALNWTLDDRAPYDGETLDDAATRVDRNNMLGIRDEERGRRDGIAELIDHPAFKESLLRPDGALGHLVQSYFKETSRRDDNDEIFTADDLPLRARGIRGDIRSRKELYELWQIIVQNPQDALTVLEEALRVALPKAVGLRVAGGDTLDSLFRASRKALRAQGQELVLIFEDLAQFGLVDGELYDQFATPPGDDLAPLRVIFAITDGPYQKMERTVKTRIEHEFHVGGSTLAQPSEFVGRYLNLVRVGRDETQRLWASGGDRRGNPGWMSNACDTRENGLACRHRDACHTTFGAVEITGLGKVGLYPYNDEALRRAIEHVGESHTPREVLDRCLSEILVEADVHIGQGSYPHERTRNQFDFRTRMDKYVVLAKNPSSDPERTYRALVIWGDESPLSAGVLEAFTLEGAAPGEPLTTRVSTTTRQPPSGPEPDIVSPSKLENKLLPLFQWQNGKELPEDDVNVLRSTLCGLTIDRLHLDQWCIHTHSGRGKEMLTKLFNTTSFDIAGARGAKAGADSIRLPTLTRSAEDTRVMVAARWFRDHGHFDPGQARWQWPEGYDPGQLMVELESRLDEWATTVRDRFLAQSGGNGLAQNAIGLYVVALASSGRDIATISTTAGALSVPSQTSNMPSAPWETVDKVATRIIGSLPVEEYVGEFAAVRQGARGAPQLVDPIPLDEAVRRFLADPAPSLDRMARSEVDPVLARDARQLLEALTAAAPAEAEFVEGCVKSAMTLLDGKSPANIGASAAAVGKSAMESGFFRPPDQWRKFGRHVDFVSDYEVVELPELGGGEIGHVLRGQHVARQIALMAHALTFIREAMDRIKAECERSGTSAGDVKSMRATVGLQVQELERLVKSLGPEVG